MIVSIRSDGSGASVVEAAGQGRIGIPFFGWAFRPLVAISQRRTARYAIARLRAELEGAPQPPAPKPVVGLPTAAFTSEQATHRAAAAAAVAVVSFASALVGQFGGPIKHTFDASDSAFSIALAITRIGALIAFIGIALADRRGRRPAILIGVAGSAVVCGVSGLAEPQLTGASSNVPSFDCNRRDGRSGRGSTRGRAYSTSMPWRSRAGRVLALWCCC